MYALGQSNDCDIFFLPPNEQMMTAKIKGSTVIWYYKTKRPSFKKWVLIIEGNQITTFKGVKE